MPCSTWVELLIALLESYLALPEIERKLCLIEVSNYSFKKPSLAIGYGCCLDKSFCNIGWRAPGREAVDMFKKEEGRKITKEETESDT